MAQYTLAEAAKTTGKSKSTILRSIRAGRISAVRDELTGGWLVEPAELHRLYSERDAERGGADDTLRNGHDAAAIRELQAERERERAQLLDQIADLRRRLDAEAEERRRLTLVLADQRSPVRPEQPRAAWRRFMAWWR
jgi:excisionase family DNA binding protein